MGKYYVAGIPFDSENSLKHYGVKGMEWDKHKFGLDADTRFIKWIDPNKLNVGSYGKYGKMAEAAAKQKYGANAPTPRGKLAPVYNKQSVMNSRDSAMRNMAKPWGRPVISKESRDSQKRQREAINNQAMQEALKQATPAKQKISAARAAEEQRMAQQKWNNSPIGRASNFVGQTTKNVGNAADRLYRESGIKGHVDNIANAITGNRDRASAESLRRTADFQADPNAPFHARADQYTPENLRKEADEYQKAADNALIPSVQRAAGNVGNAANAVGNWFGDRAQDVSQTAQNVGNWVGDRVQDAGNAVSPVAQNVSNTVGQAAQNVSNTVSDAANRAAEGTKGFLNSAGQWVSGTTNNVKNTASKAASDATKGASGFLNSAGKWVSNAAGNVKKAAADAGNAVGQVAQNVGNTVGQAAEQTRGGIGSFFDRVGNAVGGAAQNVGNWAGNAVNDVGNAVSGAANAVSDWAGQAAQDVGGAVQNAGNWIGDRAQDVGGAVSGAAQNVGNTASGAADWARNMASNVGQAAQNVGNTVGQAAQNVSNWYTGQPNADRAESIDRQVQNYERMGDMMYDRGLRNEGDRYHQLAANLGRAADANQARYDNAPRQQLSGIVENVADLARNAAGNVGNAISDAAGNVADWARNAAGNVGNAVSGAAGNVTDWARNAAQNVGNAVGDLSSNVDKFVDQNITGNTQQHIANIYNELAKQPVYTEGQKYRREQDLLNAEKAQAQADNSLFGRIRNAPANVGDWARNAVGNVGNWAGQAAQNVGGAVDQAGRWIGDQTRAAAASPAGQWLGNAAQGVGQFINDVETARLQPRIQAATQQMADNYIQYLNEHPENPQSPQHTDWLREQVKNDPQLRAYYEQNIREQTIPEQTIPEQRIPEQRISNRSETLDMDRLVNEVYPGRYKNFEDYYNYRISDPRWQNYTREDLMDDLIRDEHEKRISHSALSDKPDGVSDAFWEKFTADGGTREEYERDWR